MDPNLRPTSSMAEEGDTSDGLTNHHVTETSEMEGGSDKASRSISTSQPPLDLGHVSYRSASDTTTTTCRSSGSSSSSFSSNGRVTIPIIRRLTQGKDFNPIDTDYDDYHPEEVEGVESRSSQQRKLIRRALFGGLIGGCIALASVFAFQATFPDSRDMDSFSSGTRSSRSRAGIVSFWNLFGRTNVIRVDQDEEGYVQQTAATSSTHSQQQQQQQPRKLAFTNTKSNDAHLVIAGKMTVEDGICNIAQVNLKTNAWSLTERIQLSLYNSYSGGEVYSLLANHTVSYANGGPDVETEDRTR
jgi:hypothetical protein